MCLPRSKTFLLLPLLRDYSIRDAEDLVLCDRLDFCHYEVGALTQYLDDPLEWILHIVEET